MKAKFERKLQELMKEKHRPFLLSDEQYRCMIEETKEAKMKREKALNMNAKDYRRLKRFDVIKIADREFLIQKSDGSHMDIRYYCPASELFDVLKEVHLKLDHKKEKAMDAELKNKFCNITREIINVYLDYCETCVSKKKSKTKDLREPMLMTSLLEKPTVMSALNNGSQMLNEDFDSLQQRGMSQEELISRISSLKASWYRQRSQSQELQMEAKEAEEIILVQDNSTMDGVTNFPLARPIKIEIEDEDESEDTVIHTTMRNEATPWMDPVVQQPLPVEVEKEPVQQSPLPERQEIPEPKEIKLTPRKSYRREEYDTNDELSQRRAKKAAFSMALSSITRLRDDHQVFGDFVASSLRNIRSNKLRRKLRLDIQRAVLESSMLDDSEQSSDNI